MAYDGFFLTYKNDRETNERYDRIQSRYPNFRMVKINLEDWTIPKLFKVVRRGENASTKHFWVIDPDCKVDDSFDFDYRTTEWDEDVTHVWNADERNVFRAVVGIKLFKSSDVISKDKQHVSDAYFLTGEYKEHDTKLIKYEPTKKHMTYFIGIRVMVN